MPAPAAVPIKLGTSWCIPRRVNLAHRLTRARTAPPGFCFLFLSLLLHLPPLPALVGAEIASEGLKGRVFEFSLGDLNNDEDLVSVFLPQEPTAHRERHPPPARNGA